MEPCLLSNMGHLVKMSATTLLFRIAADDLLRPWSVSRCDDGRVLLEQRGHTHVLTHDTQLCWRFGGLGAAVDSVFLSAFARQPDGTELVLAACDILDEWGDDDPALVPECVRDRLLAALAIIAEATGCTITRL